MTDTPGHGKLRHTALSQLSPPYPPAQNMRGIIFVVDAADLAPGSDGLRAAAEYLHDALRLLVKQRQQRGSKGAFKILVAANKLDLFTALPTGLVRTALEAEVEQVRRGRERGLLDSGQTREEDAGTGGDSLGDGGEGGFRFTQLESDGVEVSVKGGSVMGKEGGDVQKWWAWIAGQL